jgi:peptidoglycan/xylan/chitin deacetylase (PgdA/CDA1 family)
MAASHTPLSILARRLELARPVIRIFNYHAVPARFVHAFETHLAHLASRFRLGRANELEQLLRDGPGERSVAFFSFDDGLANHYEQAAPLLEQWGTSGFFSVPAAFPDARPEWFRQHVYAELTELHAAPEDLEPMTWAQIGELGERGHRICAHGFDHVVLDGTTSAEVVKREVVDSRTRIEAKIPGVKVDGFCWPGRSPRTSIPASRLIEQTYAYSLGTQVRPLRAAPMYDLPRINLEVTWPTELVDLQLSGLLDGVYAGRRLLGR